MSRGALELLDLTDTPFHGTQGKCSLGANTQILRRRFFGFGSFEDTPSVVDC